MASAAPLDESLPFPVLVGDIGGTNARFALLADKGAEPQSFDPVPTADFPDIESAIESAVLKRSGLAPRSALIDVAGPIDAEGVDLTNADWLIRPAETIRRFGMTEVILLNDFEALAMALTALGDADLERIGEVRGESTGAKVVLGPGTGLGVGALVEAGNIFIPVPGEGGHVTFGPVEPDEFALWENIEPEHGRISAEALLSGRGLVRLYHAVAKTEGAEPIHATPAEITGPALAGSDPVAVRTVALYCRFLGRLAGDLALTFMARGGAYVGGGIPPRILPFFHNGEFRRAFEAKAPHAALMREIPTFVITRDSPALPGLAAFARDPSRFGVSLKGRRWRA